MSDQPRKPEGASGPLWPPPVVSHETVPHLEIKVERGMKGTYSFEIQADGYQSVPEAIKNLDALHAAVLEKVTAWEKYNSAIDKLKAAS